jgi:hypothetical protein
MCLAEAVAATLEKSTGEVFLIREKQPISQSFAP